MFATLFASKWFYFGILGLGLAGSVWFGIHEYGVAQSAAAKATAQCYAEVSKSDSIQLNTLKKSYAEEIAALKASAQKERTTLEKLASETKVTQAKYFRIQMQLRDALAKYPTAKDWYNTPIPKSIQKIINGQMCVSSSKGTTCFIRGSGP